MRQVLHNIAGGFHMSKSSSQKLKLLYLRKILLEKTDEEHTLTVPQMIDELAQYGIKSERKSIYDDLDALERFGLDIVCRKSKTFDYYVAGKTFELPELKLLADAIASSRFITEKKSKELIRKIESLASIYEAKQLQRQVYVMGRVKTMNEKIYYNVDTIHQAISLNRQIAFHYFEYNVDKEKQYRHNGEKYVASPYALSWVDENYYLVSYYEKYDNISNFRVDKMENIEILEIPCISLPTKQNFSLAEYSKKVFNMFGGEEQNITLKFDNSLIGVVLDRFGNDISIYKADDNEFIIHIKAFVSPTFLGWLFGFGDLVEILAPDSLIEYFKQYAYACLSQYKHKIRLRQKR